VRGQVPKRPGAAGSALPGAECCYDADGGPARQVVGGGKGYVRLGCGRWEEEEEEEEETSLDVIVLARTLWQGAGGEARRRCYPTTRFYIV